MDELRIKVINPNTSWDMTRRIEAAAKTYAAAGTEIDAVSLIADPDMDRARAIAERRLSSVELTREILDRIGRFNPSVNAYVNLLPDAALDRARAADVALERGERWGPLHGVPVAVKESFAIAGVRQTVGLASLADHRAPEDSEAVARDYEARFGRRLIAIPYGAALADVEREYAPRAVERRRHEPLTEVLRGVLVQVPLACIPW